VKFQFAGSDEYDRPFLIAVILLLPKSVHRTLQNTAWTSVYSFRAHIFKREVGKWYRSWANRRREDVPITAPSGSVSIYLYCFSCLQSICWIFPVFAFLLTNPSVWQTVGQILEGVNSKSQSQFSIPNSVLW